MQYGRSKAELFKGDNDILRYFCQITLWYRSTFMLGNGEKLNSSTRGLLRAETSRKRLVSSFERLVSSFECLVSSFECLISSFECLISSFE